VRLGNILRSVPGRGGLKNAPGPRPAAVCVMLRAGERVRHFSRLTRGTWQRLPAESASDNAASHAVTMPSRSRCRVTFHVNDAGLISCPDKVDHQGLAFSHAAADGL
jgi:hypothetical protein